RQAGIRGNADAERISAAPAGTGPGGGPRRQLPGSRGHRQRPAARDRGAAVARDSQRAHDQGNHSSLVMTSCDTPLSLYWLPKVEDFDTAATALRESQMTPEDRFAGLVS